jgi:hypothetical protein
VSRVRRRGLETGTAVVEAAVVTPIMVILLLGVVHVAVGWRDAMVAADAVAEAARTASLHPGVGGQAVDTGDVLDTLNDALGTMSVDSVERVVVFRPVGVAGAPALERVPGVCRGAGEAIPVTTGDGCTVVDLGRRQWGDADQGVDASCGSGGCVWRVATGEGAVGVYLRYRRRITIPGLPAGVGEVAAIAPLEGTGSPGA